MGEARRRTKAPTQVVLCYEHEPYLAFEVTPEMAKLASNPDANAEWLVAAMNWLRDEVALIRDHSHEVLGDTIGDSEKSRTLIYNASMIVQHLLKIKHERLDKAPCVHMNFLAGQTADGEPHFEMAILSQPFSVDEIRAMSTAQNLYLHDGESTKKYELKTERSKDRNKTRSCVAIAAYWRNEKPGGLGLTMKAEDGHDLDAEMELLDLLVAKFAEARPSATDCEQFLSHMAQREARGIEIAAAIAYAEEAGFLTSDEFNGMVYVYHNEDEFYIDRKDGGGMSGTIKP